jgi:signal transduction histidine kinase
MLTKKLIALLDHPGIDLGDIDSLAKASLNLLNSAFHLSDASLWLTTDQNDVNCVYVERNEDTKVIENQSIKSSDYHVFLEQIHSKSYLAYTHTNALKGQWLNIPDFVYFQSYLIPIKLNQEIIGFLLLRQAPHRVKLDQSSIQFAISIAFAIARTIKSAEMNHHFSAHTQQGLELQQSVQSQNENIKQLLINLEQSQKYQVEMEKMKALGHLVNGVAHEVNTPLGIAITALSVMEEKISQLENAYNNQLLDENTFVDFLEGVRPAHKMTSSNLERAAKLVQQFKQTSVNEHHGDVENLNILNVTNELIESIEPIYAAYNVEFILEISDNLNIRLNTGILEQILTNLINNSCIHGFELSKEDNNLIYIRAIESNQDIIINYQDNGVGIDDEISSKVFTPFYTTNRLNGGTGLGLSIIYNLITHKLGGEIRVVEQQSSIGAHFQIRIPSI